MSTVASTIPQYRARPTIKSAPTQRTQKQLNSGNVGPRADSSVKTPFKSQYQNIKSRYAQEDLKKSDNGRKLTKKEQENSKPPGDSDVKKGQLNRGDIALIKHLLVLNKKQEMMLNKRLAKLLQEEESQKHTEAKHDNFKSETNGSIKKSSHAVSNAKQTVKEEINNGKSIQIKKSNQNSSESGKKGVEENKILTLTKTKSYDIHGRRVFIVDTDKDSAEELVNALVRPLEERNSTTDILKNSKNKTFIKNANETSGRGSTLKKPTTIFTKHTGPGKKSADNLKRKTGKESGDSIKFESDNLKNNSELESKSKQAANSGDGLEIENVIVCCSSSNYNETTLLKDKKTKIWDYRSLTDVKSEDSVSKKKVDYSVQTLMSAEKFKNSIERSSSKEINVTSKSRIPIKSVRESNPLETVFFRKKFNY